MKNRLLASLIAILLSFVWVIFVSCEISRGGHGQNSVQIGIQDKGKDILPLFAAIKADDRETVRYLLSQGYDLSKRDENGFTLLQISLRRIQQSANLGVLEALLEAGADPNQEIANGSDILETALVFDNESVAELLFRHGADVNHKIGDRPVLIDAVMKKRASISKLLIRAGADVNAQNKLGRTALFYTSESDDIADLLLEFRANPNHKDIEGQTPIFEAVKHANPRLVSNLLKYGASATEKDNYQWTPLQTSMVYGCQNITDLLLGSGAKLE